MNRAKAADVLVVGAGPTGLAFAYQLRRLGVSFRIIEKNPEPSTTSKAIGLQYRVSEVLTWMGLFDRFLARGVTGTGLNFYASGERILHLRLDRLDGMSGRGAFEPQSIVIPQSETEALLIEALGERGVEVERSTTFVEFTQDNDRVISRIRGADGVEELIESRYLVSCEGPHSMIRKQAGLSFAGKTYPVSYFMADVELDWAASRNDVHVWIHEDGMFSAIPMPGERRWRLFVESGKQVEEGATEVTLDLVRWLMAERTGDHITQASDPTWLSEFRISCRMVDRFSNGRVFLAGDAAHIHSPTGGQGITTGVQDAYNLAWKLDLVLRGAAPDSLLDTYAEERLPIVRRVLKTTDQTASVFLAHSCARQLFRDRVVLPLLRSRVMQKRLTRRLSQLDMNYRGTSLSDHQETGLLGRARVRAGDRAPDVVFRDARTGAETSLFASLGHSRLVALFGQGQDPAGTEDRTTRIEQLMEALGRLGVECFLVWPESTRQPDEGLVDIYGDFHRLYGARGEFLYLIRPDGYVGLFQRLLDERALQTYMAKLFRADAIDSAFAAQAVRIPVEAGR
ncbi:MAG: FAD-dependent monooxygenase [Actinomycetota bacterium]|nr:FAD-dependent monooxygenase [Actinomycetota bacterium]